MASKRSLPIETPGETASQAPAAEQADPVTEAPAETVVTVAVPTAELTPVQEATLQRDLQATARLVGSSEALDWSQLNNGLTPAAGRKDPDAGLPESADPETITAPVLTRSGWVLPANDPRARFGQR